MVFIYFLLLFIISSTPFACACVPQTFLIYPMNAIVLLGFTGMLYFHKFQPKHLIYYMLTALFLGFIFPAIPVFSVFTFPIGIILFITAFVSDSSPALSYGCGAVILLILLMLIPVLSIPALIIAIILFSLRRRTSDKKQADMNSNEVSRTQKIVTGIIFTLVLLTVPLYAIYIGTDVRGILLFFSLLMVVLAIIFIRSIIRRSGIAREEWLSRLVVSGLLFFTVAGITLNIKMNTFFGSNMDNYMSVLAVKKMQFLLVFFMLLIVPALFICEEYLVKRKLAADMKGV
ncbi:MAG: hypothetical protein ABRQ37_06495 [Candidatus Eremiobacterota bacterium]